MKGTSHLFTFLFLFISVYYSCGNKATSNEQPEISIKDSTEFTNPDNFTDTLKGANTKSDDYYDNQETPFLNILGCWAAIREGNITITFNPDTSFVFYDYNSTLHDQEELKGKFQIKDEVLILFYDDRPKQKFVFKKDTNDVSKYYIEGASGYYFIRSNCL